VAACAGVLEADATASNGTRVTMLAAALSRSSFERRDTIPPGKPMVGARGRSAIYEYR
jgi:hypothetical protein